MPIQYPEEGGSRAVFAGLCVTEEGDALLDWLRRTSDAEADLTDCTDLHTALVQLLMAARVRLVAPPADRLLAAFLGAAMPPPALRETPKPRRIARKPGRKVRS